MQTESDHPSHERKGIALMLCSVMLFASTSLLLSLIHQRYAVDGWIASAYRGLIGLVVVFLLQSSTGKLRLHRLVTNRLLLLRGILGGATIPIYYFAIMELGPGRAGMISGAYPLFAALFAMFLLGEPLPRRYFAYITLAILGVAAIFSDRGVGDARPFYDAMALAGAVAAGVCVVLIRHLRHSETTSTIFAAQCVFTLAICLLVTKGNILIGDPAAFALVLLAAVTVVGGQLAITEAFRHINVAKGSTLQMLTPATTVIGSAVLLGETFSLLALAGGCAVLFASYRIVLAKAFPLTPAADPDKPARQPKRSRVG